MTARTRASLHSENMLLAPLLAATVVLRGVGGATIAAQGTKTPARAQRGEQGGPFTLGVGLMIWFSRRPVLPRHVHRQRILVLGEGRRDHFVLIHGDRFGIVRP
jgi:hypothetical protein